MKKNLLAIGSAATAMVTELGRYDNYKIYTIASRGRSQSPEIEHFSHFVLAPLPSPEEYEQACTLKVNKFLKKIEDNLTVFVCGASRTSASILKILEPIYNRGVKINIIYLMPEVGILSKESEMQERAVRSILQEYSRSGLFERISLISNQILESLVESVDVFNYYEQINKAFTTSYHMLNVFKNTDPVISTFSKIPDSRRISTMGLSSLEGNDVLLYPFEEETDILYYFGINHDKLKAQKNLLRTMMDKIKSRITKDLKVSFAVYSTEYEEDYIYVEYFSPKTQNLVEL